MAELDVLRISAHAQALRHFAEITLIALEYGALESRSFVPSCAKMRRSSCGCSERQNSCMRISEAFQAPLAPSIARASQLQAQTTQRSPPAPARAVGTSAAGQTRQISREDSILSWGIRDDSREARNPAPVRGHGTAKLANSVTKKKKDALT